VFGGTIGTAEEAERDRHTIGIFNNTSTAMQQYASQRRKDSISAAAAAVDELNKPE
jgi:hypothetical protein